MSRQLSMTRKIMGEKAWRKHVDREVRNAFRPLVAAVGGKVMAALCGTGKGEISMAANGTGNRGIPVSWLAGIDTVDPERAVGQALARVVYDSVLVPIDQLTPEQKLRLLEARVRATGPAGDALIDEFHLEIGT